MKEVLYLIMRKGIYLVILTWSLHGLYSIFTQPLHYSYAIATQRLHNSYEIPFKNKYMLRIMRS